MFVCHILNQKNSVGNHRTFFNYTSYTTKLIAVAYRGYPTFGRVVLLKVRLPFFLRLILSNFPNKFKGRCSVHVKQYVTIISQSTSLILHVVNDVSVSYTLIAKRSEHYVERLPT